MQHIPRPALRAMAMITAGWNPATARHARAALVMDTIGMTYDPAPTRQALPGLSDTDMPTAVKELLA